MKLQVFAKILHLWPRTKNQEQIIHVVEDSITILNMTQAEVSENRQAIMELVKSIHRLDSKPKTS